MLREYQDALQAAIVAVSESQLRIAASWDKAALARRIDTALTELDKLSAGQIPDYSHPDVALFYSQWYLPEQVNLAYSESVQLLTNRAKGLHGQTPLQLVDFGAGSGAMILGLSLALANHVPREHWPEFIGVFQIDVPAMLDLGDRIWHVLSTYAGRHGALSDVSELMSRTMFGRINAGPTNVVASKWSTAERWLAALHVIYEESLRDTKETHETLKKALAPHASLVTAPQLKAERIENSRDGYLYLRGTADRIGTYREHLVTQLEGHLNDKATNYLRAEVRWASRYVNKRPVASSVLRQPTQG